MSVRLSVPIYPNPLSPMHPRISSRSPAPLPPPLLPSSLLLPLLSQLLNSFRPIRINGGAGISRGRRRMHLPKSNDCRRTLAANFDFVPLTCDVVPSFGAFRIFFVCHTDDVIDSTRSKAPTKNAKRERSYGSSKRSDELTSATPRAVFVDLCSAEVSSDENYFIEVIRDKIVQRFELR